MTIAAPARAGVVDTFSFAQGGYAGAIAPGASGALSGAFTGVVEANGTIGLADLRSITLAYTAGARRCSAMGRRSGSGSAARAGSTAGSGDWT